MKKYEHCRIKQLISLTESNIILKVSLMKLDVVTKLE